MPKKKTSPAWWKQNDDDVLIARLSMEDLYGLISSCADLAPKEWLKEHLPKLKKRLREKKSGNSLRAVMSGLRSGTGGQDRDLGQKEAVILRADSDLLDLTRDGLKTQGAWEDLGRFGHYGKRMEAVILDTRSVRSEVPLQLDLHGGGLRATVDLDLVFSGEQYRRVLNLLDEEGLASEGACPSLLTKAMLEEVIRRRMEDRAADCEEFSVGFERLAEDENARDRAETALQDALTDWLPEIGMGVKRCRLRLQKSKKQLREKELQEQAEDREYERKLDLARQQDEQHRKTLAANDAVAEEKMRCLLVTATAATEIEVARIEIEGFRERKEAEREENRRDAEQEQELKAKARELEREQQEKDADSAKRAAEKRQEAEQGDLDLNKKRLDHIERAMEVMACEPTPPNTSIPKSPVFSPVPQAPKAGASTTATTSTELYKCGNCGGEVDPQDLGYCGDCLQVKVHLQKAWFRKGGEYTLPFILENAGKAPFRVSRIICKDGFRDLPQQSRCYEGVTLPGDKWSFQTGVDVKKIGRRPIRIEVHLKWSHSARSHRFTAHLQDAIQVTDRDDPLMEMANRMEPRPMHFLPPHEWDEKFTADGKIVTMATKIRIPYMYKQETMGDYVELTPQWSTVEGPGLLLGRDSPREDRTTHHALRFPTSLDPDGEGTDGISREHWRIFPHAGAWHLEQLGSNPSWVIKPGKAGHALPLEGESTWDLQDGMIIFPLAARRSLGFKLVHTAFNQRYVTMSELRPYSSSP